jgi:peptidoglycan/xylan/chitin deacetylase (PgdA/CDA1 family)
MIYLKSELTEHALRDLLTSVVIVNVHGVGTPPRALDPGEDVAWISVAQLETVLDAAVGRPGIQLTFDDGNASDVEIALPRLLERGLTAEFFIAAGLLGDPGRLDKDGVRELHRAGMPVSSHGWAHRDWRRLTPEQVHEEFVEAPRFLAGLTGSPVTRHSIPFGSYDRRVLSRLRSVRATQAYTSDGGRTRPGGWLQARNSLRDTVDTRWVEQVMLGRPSLPQRARRVAATTVKGIR